MFGPEITGQLQRLERQIAEMECRAMTNEAETIDQLRADLELRQLQVERTTQEKEQIRADRDTFRSEITVLNAQIELLKDKLDEAQRDKEKMQEVIDGHDAQVEEITKEKKTLESAVHDLRLEREALLDEVYALREEVGAGGGGGGGGSSVAASSSAADALGRAQAMHSRAEKQAQVLATLQKEHDAKEQQQDPNVTAATARSNARQQELEKLAQQAHASKQRAAAAAPPKKLDSRQLNMLQNAISAEARQVQRKRAFHDYQKHKQQQQQQRGAPVEPSPWEAFKILRDALDHEEEKLHAHPVVPSAAGRRKY